jgi:hypothetical protein
MFLPRTKTKKSSKKRFNVKSHASSKKRTPYTTIYINFPDGSSKKISPDMEKFDGDWESLAISQAGKGERVTWKLS